MTVDWGRIARHAVEQQHALQKPAELAGLLETVAGINPKLVVEIGCDRGGTLWAWEQLGADVLGVSLIGGPYSSGPAREQQLLDRHGAEVIVADSHELATWLQVHEAVAGRPVDLLFIDGDHSYDGVQRDVMAYLPLVRPGGYVALHDVCRQAGRPEVGAWRVWEQLRGLERFAAATEIISEPATWGGIGLIQIGAA